MAQQRLWQFCLRTLSAVRANSVRAAVLGNVRFEPGQFGYLMSPGIALRCNLPAVCGEAALAMPATGRQQIDYLIDALRRRQSAPTSSMSGLTTGLATALLPFAAALTRLARQPVRRGRLR